MQFDFGENWKDFAQSALTAERANQARADFARLMSGITLSGRRFLDIGFGQGLSLLSAVEAGADGVGCDINPKCKEALERARFFFPIVSGRDVPVVIGSILDDDVLGTLRGLAAPSEGFDIVHSWGALHHTGDMKRAFRNAGSLVKPGGHFVVAIYNRHWSSLPWLWIKWGYCRSPALVRRLMIGAMIPVIWLAKWLATGQAPRKKERGMDFYFDVVDWVGGYPYEYGRIEDVRTLCEPMGFSLLRAKPAEVPTGCNEFAFKRSSAGHR